MDRRMTATQIEGVTELLLTLLGDRAAVSYDEEGLKLHVTIKLDSDPKKLRSALKFLLDDTEESVSTAAGL